MNNNETIKFSVGIPAFKGYYLKDCIQSVLDQEYTNFELVIINDCSPDPIDEIIAQFTDNRILYFKNKKNIGAEHVVDNWNLCLSKATGDFFVLMGDDDKIDKDYLSAFNILINKYPTLDVYHCRSIIIDESSLPVSVTPSWPEFETVYENIWHRLKKHRLQFISDFVYRTEKLKENKGYYKLPLAWASDDISAYIAMSDKGIAHTNAPVFKYRRNRYTISSGGNVELKVSAIYGEHDWLKKFLQKRPLDPIELIFYDEILHLLDDFTNKKLIYTLSEYFRLNKRKAITTYRRLNRQYKFGFANLTRIVFNSLK